LKQISYILHSPNRATSEWCGNIDNAFEGIKTHVIGSGFKGELVVVLFEEIDIESTIEFKQIIRETAKNGKFSVHTSDSFNETIDLISVILSEESRNLITKNRASDYRIFGRLFDLYSYINRSLIPKESFVLTGSAGMGVAGIRDISDIDIIPGSNLHSIEPDPSSGINIQKENLFNKSFNALIYNRENYFSFFGLKFVVLHEIRRMKKTRGEFPKDVLDVKLIDEFLGEKKSQIWRQVFFWWKLRGFRILLMFRKGKVLLYQLLVRMKIYGPLRYVIDKIVRYF